MKTLIQISQLSHDYIVGKGKVNALSDITFSIKKGEFVCLTGPSGCGKSTLAAIMSGLIAPTNGAIQFDGSTAQHTLKKVTLVSQEDTLFPWKNVFDNIMLGMYSQHISENDKKEKAAFIMNEFGLEKHAHLYPGQLSGGLKQRLNIARAIAYAPEVLILDEPFSALDIETKTRVQNSLLRVWKELKLTIVYITHSISESVVLSDTIYVMRPSPGEIVLKVSVDLPRPRDGEVRRSKAFLEYETTLFQKLKEFV